MGDNFLQLFNYTLFDYDNKKITFYSEQDIIKMNNMNQISYLILIINSILGFSSVIMLIIINKVLL